jgi:hypothetical protein
MTIKLARACRLTRHLPRAQAEILESIPPALTASLTGRELAMVMDALNHHWHKARAFERAEILGEGCIWDPKAEALIELYPARYYRREAD